MNSHSKKGITLVELIVAMTLTSIFAVLCVMLINPIERTYKSTLKLARAQLLADTLIDSIRKECDDVKHDDKASVWITNLSGDDSALLSTTAHASNDPSGNTLVIRRNNNFAESIYAGAGINSDISNVVDNTLTPTGTAHAVATLKKTDPVNLNSGYVHFGYYQGKEDDAGFYPIEAYDYTNPVMAKTYGNFTVELNFDRLALKDDKYPAYVMCTVTIMENGKKIYSRTAVLCFAANGSGHGSGIHSGGGHSNQTKNVDVRVIWLDARGKETTWPSTVNSLTFNLCDPDRTGTLLNGQKRITFTNVRLTDETNLEAPVLEKFDRKISGKASSGYTVTYKAKNEKTVKMVCGEWFVTQLGKDVAARSKIKKIVFGSKTQWAEAVRNTTGIRVAIPIDAGYDKNEPASRRKEDYMLYKVTDTDGKIIVYVLSDDGTFVLNENCTKMFQQCLNVETITGITGPGEDTSIFDTSRVTTMKSMLESCASIRVFEMPGFVTDSCKSTEAMFMGCSSVTLCNFEGWDTSNVENMNFMFNSFHAVRTDNVPGTNDIVPGSDEPFVLDVSDLSFASCKTMKYMFSTDHENKNWKIPTSARNLTQIIFSSKIDTSKVTDMQSAFSGNNKLTEITNLRKFDFSSVTTIKNLFKDDSELASIIGLNDKDFSKLTDCDSPFSGCTKLLNLNISGIKIPLITKSDDFKKMFNGSSIQNLDMSEAQLGLTTFEKLFSSNKQFVTIDFSNVKAGNVSADNMFSGCTSLTSVDISCTKADSFKLTNGFQMFKGCTKLTSLDISGLIKNNCTNISEMFYNCVAIPAINFEGSDYSGLTTMKDLCRGCEELKTLDLTKNCITSNNVINCQSIVRMCHKLESFTATGLSVSTLQQAFDECFELTSVNLSNINASECVYLTSMFNKCSKLEEFDFNGFVRREDGILDFSKVVSIQQMFNQCTSLKSVKNMTNIDFSSIENQYVNDTGKTDTSLKDAFNGTKLSELNISGIKLPKITTHYYFFVMLNNVTIRTLNMSNATLTGFTTLEGMFKGKTNYYSISLANATFGSVDSAKEMFSGCTGLKSIDLSGVVLNSCTTCESMLNGCNKLETIVMSNFKTPDCTKMNSMFRNCSSVRGYVTLTGWDTGKVTDMASMFEFFAVGNGNRTIYADDPGYVYLDISGFNFVSVTQCNQMFNVDKNTQTDFLKKITLPANANAEALTTTKQMFRNRTGLESIVNLGTFKTSNLLTDTTSTFADCRSMTVIDVSSMNFSKVDNAKFMFNAAKDKGGNLTTIYVSANPEYAFNPSILSADNSTNMFENRVNLVGGKGTTYDASNLNRNYARIDEGPASATPGYFSVK